VHTIVVMGRSVTHPSPSVSQLSIMELSGKVKKSFRKKLVAFFYQLKFKMLKNKAYRTG
jgi:hypothetical protein